MLIWDDQAVDHIARHSVTRTEVEEAYAGRRVPFQAHSGRDGFVSETNAGRLLAVVLEEIRAGTYRCVTARDASRRKRRLYAEAEKTDA